jgi:transposase
MSLHSDPIGPVPEETARIARAAFRKGNLCIRLRDVLGTIYVDEEFADLISSTGRPAEARLSLSTGFCLAICRGSLGSTSG